MVISQIFLFQRRYAEKVYIWVMDRVVNFLGQGFPATCWIQRCCVCCSFSFASEIGCVSPRVNIFHRRFSQPGPMNKHDSATLSAVAIFVARQLQDTIAIFFYCYIFYYYIFFVLFLLWSVFSFFHIFQVKMWEKLYWF